jgi:hypothetical protein
MAFKNMLHGRAKIKAYSQLFFLFLPVLAAVVFFAMTPFFAGADPDARWTCDHDRSNSQIDVTAEYGSGTAINLAITSLLYYTVDATGAQTDMLSNAILPLAKSSSIPGTRDRDKYPVRLAFRTGGDIIEAESRMITWGDANSGTGGDNDNPVPVVAQDQGGPFERLIASIIDCITYVAGWVTKNFIGAKSYSALIFNAGVDKQRAPFTSSEMDTIWTWYRALAAGSLVLVVIAVAVTAFKFTASPFNISLREDAMSSMWRWLLAILFIACAPVFFYAMIRINNGLVDLFLSVANRVSSVRGMDAMLDPAQVANTGDVLATAIVKLVFTFIGLYLTVIYEIRRFVLIVILIFTPIMAWLWSFNKNVNAVQIWFGEMLSNIFMQAAHAFVFLVLLSFISLGSGQASGQAGAAGLSGDPNALGQSLMDLLTDYGVPLGGAVLLASVCWVAVQLITARFSPDKRESAIGNLMYVGAGGIIFGGVVFFASLILGIAKAYFPHAFMP